MAHQVGKTVPKRTKPTYIYSIISVSLVLFMLGMLGLLVLHAHKLSEYFKENIEVIVYLKNNVKEADIYLMQKQIEAEPYIKSTEYISKSEAANIMKEKFNENFIDIVGYNPLPASVNIKLYADYANPDSLMWIEQSVLQYNQVQEVFYQKTLLQSINENVEKLSLYIIIISALLIFMAITLIDNTIRLAMYSNRFLIRSMQLVGAMRWFIIKPFIAKSILNGAISAIMAVTSLIVLLYYGQQYMPELVLLLDVVKFSILFAIIILIGIFISWLSTYRAVRKYLYMKLDALY